LAGNLEKAFMSLYGTEWRERGYGLGRIREIMLATVTVFLHKWSHIQQQPKKRGHLLFYTYFPFPWGRAQNKQYIEIKVIFFKKYVSQVCINIKGCLV
jgi:hypothetical protein